MDDPKKDVAVRELFVEGILFMALRYFVAIGFLRGQASWLPD